MEFLFDAADLDGKMPFNFSEGKTLTVDNVEEIGKELAAKLSGLKKNDAVAILRKALSVCLDRSSDQDKAVSYSESLVPPDLARHI